MKQREFVSNALIIVVCLILIFSVGCKKEKTKWDADFAFPIAQTTLSINQLIADSLLATDANNHIIISYDNRILNYGIDSMISIPDTVTTYSIASVSSGTINAGQTLASSVETKSFPFEPARITQVDIENGYLLFTCINPLNVPLKATYSIPAAKRYGQSFYFSETIPAAQGNTPYRYESKIDLRDFSIDLRGPNLNNCNRFLTNLNIVTDPNGGSAQIYPGQQFKFFTKFDGLRIRYVKGYLGDDIQTTGPDTTMVDFFKKITAGTVSLNSMDVNIKVTNGIGADITMIPQLLKGVNKRTSEEVSLAGDIIGRSYNITRSRETHLPSQPVIPSVLQLDFANTNILDLLEALPEMMIFKSTLKLNPMGNISCGNDFIYAQNGLTMDLKMKIPLTFKANTLTLCDTIDYSISKNSGLNSGSITLMMTNSFPVSAKIKLYILNSSSQITDEITNPNQTILAGKEINNIPVGTNSTIQINLPNAVFNRLVQSKKLLMIAELNTAGSTFASIHSQSKIRVKIVGNFNSNIEM